MRKLAFAMACSAFLASCDGGSSSNPPPVTPTPTPPAAGGNAPGFTSAGTINVAENEAGTIYTAVATDPEGSAVTYTLSGGPDQGLFNLDTAGRLSFKAAPDYEAPTDSNTNNLYQVEITASDGNRTTVLPLNIFVTDISANGLYRLSVIGRPFTGLQRITGTAEGSGGGSLQEDTGNLVCFDWFNAKPDARLCLSAWTGQVDKTDFSYQEERGFLGWTWSARLGPGAGPFETRGYGIALWTAANGDLVLAWTKLEDPIIGRNNASPIAGLPPIWRIPSTAIRNLGGWIAFGPDGYLYIAIGDGEVGARAQDPASPFGKILRIDPFRDDFPADPNRNFGVPASGTIVAALGLRRPTGVSFDVDGNLIIPDRGESQREEVNVLRAGESGVNFGWPYLEGRVQLQAGGPAGMRAPAIELEHGTGPRNSNKTVGGEVYTRASTAPKAAPLIDQYIFGDTSGKIWMVPRARLLAGNLTGADLTRTEELLYSTGNPLRNILWMSSRVVFDDSGLYYFIDP